MATRKPTQKNKAKAGQSKTMPTKPGQSRTEPTRTGPDGSALLLGIMRHHEKRIRTLEGHDAEDFFKTLGLGMLTGILIGMLLMEHLTAGGE